MYDVIIIGSGPAGLTAAIYTARANLKTLVIAGSTWGGQLQLTTLVENYPGFPEGIQGPELMANMRKQAEHHGVEFIDDDFPGADFSQMKSPFTIAIGDKTFEGKALLIATGADTKWIGISGEKERIGRGVSSCAPCDAPFFKNKKVIVVGGGDSAMEEACVLTNYAEHVTVMYRGDTLKASQIMQDKAKAHPKITIVYNTVLTEILGENKVEKVKVESRIKSQALSIVNNNQAQQITVEKFGGTVNSIEGDTAKWEYPIDGIFVAIGHIPNTKVFRGITTDDRGYIQAKNRTQTNGEGVFVAGDVEDNKYMQAVTAAGFGCMAALDIEHWIREKE